MLQFYNSLTRKKEPFIPIEEGKVKLYTCGPTVYDTAHIGNFRTFLFEDFLKRVLIARGYKVLHVMNITDVDDKTIKKTEEEGKSLSEITSHYTDLFNHDLKTLNILPADHYPAATNHVDDMIKMIEVLIEKCHAYKTDDGSVFFKIESFKDYGVLTHINMAEMQQSNRVDSDEYGLDNPQDFALWKAYKEEDGDVAWDSPWGKGRPGWHIECSAMSMAFLGDHFDIHCGGVDNKFPHHENEIAQSVCASDRPFVNTWLHSEFLMVDGGKMSKSLGNFYCISDLIEKGFTPEEIRYIMLSGHYRTKINFTLDKQHEAKASIQRIQSLKDRLQDLNENDSDEFPVEKSNFDTALENDLDAPNSLALFFDWVRATNSALDKDALSRDDVAKGLNFISYFNDVFGVLSESATIPKDVMELVSERELARQNKDWAKSDKLRDLIGSKGWVVKDTPDGPKLISK
ncbi:MAG: cysteine--tRNA ligase [Candidatus Marinimicrobia bacterium]|nr:cysteine--tRNA ligase [Candidatus Neomarinimicrobiota bacterium]